MRCPGCKGTVKNVDHKRHTVERLAAIHTKSCPQRERLADAWWEKAEQPTDDEPVEVAA